METTNTNAANIPDGSLVVFTPRGQDVELKGKVTNRYTSTLDNNLYLRIKAEDGRTYTKQFKNVALFNGELPKSGGDELPESLLNELRKLTGKAVKPVRPSTPAKAPQRATTQRATAEKEVKQLVKKYFRQELFNLAKALG